MRIEGYFFVPHSSFPSERSEKNDEYRAWAEEQMSNMGFGFEGD